MYHLLAIVIGAFMAIMIPMNGILSEMTGIYKGSVLIHIIGFIGIIIVLFMNKEKIEFQKGIPMYLYSAGAIGVFTVLFISMSFSSLGVSLTIALSLLGQSVTSIVVDHFGLLGMKIMKFEQKKLIGLSLIASGIIVMTIF
ncbi:membrane protein [Bacillus manliponensis]|uniref:Membrane protein n=1 Tax=Bacillus manliponensis TaxID=574376 RepID=A0A073K2L9_9BACI|nr:DMT family transporter [Bacillus manliponensis]KEK20745.1 membrane protein [Bacillus manliponensis]